MPALPPPPVDDALEALSRKPSPTWAKWFQLLWDKVRGRVYARARLASAQGTTSTPTVIGFDTTDYDTLGAITGAGTTGWKFTAPVGQGGVFLVSASVLLTSNGAAGTARIDVYINGSQSQLLGFREVVGVGDWQQLSGSMLVALSDGDYFDLRVSHASGGTRNTSSNGFDNQVSVLRVADL